MQKFAHYTQALREADALTSPSEAHGMMCGFISAGLYTQGLNWLEPILGFSPQEPLKSTLLEMYAECSQEIASSDYDFQLLLPDDEKTDNENNLDTRAQALGEWCQGFMTGFGLAGIDIDILKSEELRDALYHISEIAQIDYEEISISNDDESAFTEIYEYIRLATLSIYNDIHEFETHSHIQAEETIH